MLSQDAAIDMNVMAVSAPLPVQDYLHRFFDSLDMARFADGSVVPQLKKSILAAVPIPLPPLAEQRRIVERIDELFAEIAEGEAALQRARRDLDIWRRALLKSAVTGELTRDWREANHPTETGAELLSRIRTKMSTSAARTRRPRFPTRPLGHDDVIGTSELPQNWVWACWRDVGLSQNGRAFPSKSYTTSGIKLIRPGNLFADGSVQWNEANTRYLPNEFLDKNKDLFIDGEELIINLTAQSLKDDFLGRVCPHRLKIAAYLTNGWLVCHHVSYHANICCWS
jgi:type I restriction enzyme S subunit